MSTKVTVLLSLVGFLWAFPVLVEGQSSGASRVSVPAGTTIDTLTYEGDAAAAIALKPEEQVAFLFAYGIWNLESQCADKSYGVGRLCSLSELVHGVRPADGNEIALSVNPARDTNYSYSVQLIGGDCIILVVPRVKGLGGFAVVGSPAGFGMGHFYYNPDGPNMVAARRLGSMGFSGSGFSR